MTTAPTTPRLAENRERGSHSVQRLVPHHGRTHLDLFSGIGGFALAAQAAGWTTIAFAEIETYACKILKQNWPDVPNLGDIRNVRGIRADLITGGFPCQPFSHAGKRRGAEDDRHLWPEMLRIIADARPTWVLGENVAGIIGMELDGVLAGLEGIGYAAWPLVVPACALDARHRRDRVWIAAHATGGLHRAEQECERDVLGRGQNALAHGEERIVAGQTLADAKSEQAGRIQQRPIPAYARASSDGPAAPFAWPTEPGVGRVADGIPNRPHRLKGLGNAIVPQVAEVILREMARMMGNSDSTERIP